MTVDEHGACPNITDLCPPRGTELILHPMNGASSVSINILSILYGN
jgi:hypothetical protein